MRVRSYYSTRAARHVPSESHFLGSGFSVKIYNHYIRLVFTVIVGFALFHEVPGIWTVVGAGVVVISTLFITWREHLANRAKVAAAALVEPV